MACGTDPLKPEAAADYAGWTQVTIPMAAYA